MISLELKKWPNYQALEIMILTTLLWKQMHKNGYSEQTFNDLYLEVMAALVQVLMNPNQRRNWVNHRSTRSEPRRDSISPLKREESRSQALETTRLARLGRRQSLKHGSLVLSKDLAPWIGTLFITLGQIIITWLLKMQVPNTSWGWSTQMKLSKKRWEKYPDQVNTTLMMVALLMLTCERSHLIELELPKD